MTIRLKNSVFIHIPKTGGRWVTRQLQHVEGFEYIGDPIYDAHATPNVELPVFAFVRHPVAMLNSLWKHRSRKHSNRRHKEWNWQKDHQLERECGCADYMEFFERVAARPGIVTNYYWEFVGKYPRCTVWKMENIAEELIAALTYYSEKFDAARIRQAADKRIGFVNDDMPILHRPELIKKIIGNEQWLCRKYNYTEDLTAQ